MSAFCLYVYYMATWCLKRPKADGSPGTGVIDAMWVMGIEPWSLAKMLFAKPFFQPQ